MSQQQREEVALADLRQRLPKTLTIDDKALLRFLRARKFDVKAAHEMFMSTLQWRVENKADTVLDHSDPNEEVYQHLTPHRFHGFDKEGRPIYIERTGMVKVPEVLKHLTEQDLIDRHVRSVEEQCQRAEHASRCLGKTIETQCVIMDLKGMSASPDGPGMRVFRATLNISQNYYPERLGKMFIINAPWWFRGVWGMVKGWLDPVTKNKFCIQGSNYQAKLLEVIDANQLPEEYGGTCVCVAEDRLCVMKPRPYDPVKPTQPWCMMGDKNVEWEPEWHGDWSLLAKPEIKKEDDSSASEPPIQVKGIVSLSLDDDDAKMPAIHDTPTDEQKAPVAVKKQEMQPVESVNLKLTNPLWSWYQKRDHVFLDLLIKTRQGEEAGLPA